MDCVESRKLSEAQNCPARALFSFIQDLSTSVTSSAKIADTVNVKKIVRYLVPTDFHLIFKKQARKGFRPPSASQIFLGSL